MTPYAKLFAQANEKVPVAVGERRRGKRVKCAVYRDPKTGRLISPKAAARARKMRARLRTMKRDSKGRLLPLKRRTSKRAARASAASPRKPRRVVNRPRRTLRRRAASASKLAGVKRRRLTRSRAKRSSSESKETRPMARRRRRMPARNKKGRFVKGARAAAAESPRRRRRRRRSYARAAAPNPARRHRRRRRSYARAAAPNPVRRHRRRRRSYARTAREKLPGGRIRVKRHMVHYRRRNIPTHGYTRHVSKPNYQRGPYTYRRAHENPIAGEGYAMENPLSMGEMVVMGVVGALGFGLGSFVDRLICSNPVTVNSSNQLVETPAAGAVYNTEAVTAPMSLMRWAVGLGVPLVLATGAAYIGGPWTKVVLQGAAVGWGIRTLGKGLDDLMAYMLGGSASTPGSGAKGAQWYAPEIQAINAVKAVGTTQLQPISQASAYSLNSPSVQTLQGIPQIMQQQQVQQRSVPQQRPAPQQHRCASCGKVGVGAPAQKCAECSKPAPAQVEPKRNQLAEGVGSPPQAPAPKTEAEPVPAGFFRRAPAGTRWQDAAA